MNSTSGASNEHSTPSTQATGRRSASLEKHRRQPSGGYRDGYDVSMSKLNHSRSQSSSSTRENVAATQDNGGGHNVVGTVAPPPKERLLPSPPLTPVASVSSLRKAAAKGAVKERSDLDAAILPVKPKSMETFRRVASDRTDLSDDVDATEDDVDTEADGAASTWSSRPDGATEVSTTQEGTNVDGGDDGVSATGLAPPVGAIAVPESSSYDTPQELRLAKEDRDPLSGAHDDTYNGVPGGSSNLEKSLPGTSSSSMPPDHEASSSVPMPPRALYAGPSPQPWDLVEPPPDNNVELLQRVRKESNRSLALSPGVVVKDGKKYHIPLSSYYFGPPSDTSVFGTDPIGQIGVHHPREIVRIERDYSYGELPQFSPAYPLELEGRITPTQFLETINSINETLLEAHSLRWSFFDNTLAVLTLYISRLIIPSYYDRKMKQLKERIQKLNKELYNPVGLNILWPRNAAFMFLEIEYY